MKVLFFFLALSAAADFATEVQPFLKEHCFSCHGPEKQKGKLRLDTLDADFSKTHTANVWIEVRHNLNLGEMPPEDEPRPDADAQIAVSKWIASQLKSMQAQANSTGGKVQLRRLSRSEYISTVRDLLRVTFVDGNSPYDILPPDGSLEGFDKVSKALLLDPSLMDKYFAAAQLVASRAVRLTPEPVPSVITRLELEDPVMGYRGRSSRPAPGGVNLYKHSVGVNQLKHPFSEVIHNWRAGDVPIRGTYTIRVRAGASRGHSPDKPLYMDISRGQGNRKRFEVTAPVDAPEIYEFTTVIDPGVKGGIQIHIINGDASKNGHPGHHNVDNIADALYDEGKKGVSFRLRGRGRSEGSYSPDGMYRNAALKGWEDLSKLPHLFLDWVELEGPLQEDFPPASTRLIFREGFDDPTQHTAAHARNIFRRLLPRAFRRPVRRSESEVYETLVAEELANGADWQTAMRAGIAAVLCAPDFLYLFEPNPENTPRSLTQYELATRLSYFLWSSMPDGELFRLAANNKLADSATLEAQVQRMLADPKAEALVADFANQWLKIYEFDKFQPDQNIYQDSFWAPAYGGITDDLKGEASAFFREILTTDASVLNFLDSEWIMANEKVARYYGLPDIRGEEFRRVALPADSPRGGIIGMAGFHLWGADGSRTKPVERGKYLLSVLFNDPPDPPPPNAGEVEPNIKGESLTVRERLLRHQEVEACAGCHRGIDPYGLGMENFNAVGRWRDKQDGEQKHGWGDKPIINEGSLPNGKAYANFAEFKDLLSSQTGRFERGLAEKLFIYALGRTLEPSDDAVLGALVAEMPQHQHSLRGLISGIVKTKAFGSK